MDHIQLAHMLASEREAKAQELEAVEGEVEVPEAYT
jgi:hypothetical protein